MELDRVLAVARDAALAGGEAAVSGATDLRFLTWKGPHDPLVGRAFDVQQAIVDTIHSDFPDHAVLCEEGPDDEVMPIDADPLWIVDPICGSTNYLQHDPHYGVCVGY